MKFSVVKFFAYNIRSTVLSGVKMYLVSDLLNQYNEKHNVNKKFKDYLRIDQTKELLENWSMYTRGEDLHPVCQSDESFVGEDLHLQNTQEESAENDTNHWDIEGVIKYVTFRIATQGGNNKGYVICEELLIACLMWADPQFAISVYTFLKNCREKDNDFLKKEVMKLRDRYIPDDEESQWTYILSFSEINNNIILQTSYVHQTIKGYFIKGNKIYVKNLPNGYIFKKNAYDNLFPVILKYGGNVETITIQLEDVPEPIIRINKNKFIIPKESWNADHKYIIRDICIALQKTRQDLCWRNDIELDEYIDE